MVVSQSARYIVPSHVGDPQSSVAPLAVGMFHLWRQLEAAGKTVIPIRSTPSQPTVVPRCAASHRWPFAECIGTKGEVLFDSAISSAARNAGKVPLDLTKYFCVSGQCPAVIEGAVPACLADESSRKAGCFGYTSGSLRKAVLTLAAQHSGRKG